MPPARTVQLPLEPVPPVVEQRARLQGRRGASTAHGHHREAGQEATEATAAALKLELPPWTLLLHVASRLLPLLLLLVAGVVLPPGSVFFSFPGDMWRPSPALSLLAWGRAWRGTGRGG